MQWRGRLLRPGRAANQSGPRARISLRQLLDRGEGGASLVEFAIASSILLTLIFGVMNLSLALYAYHFISNAAREGTRYAIVRGSACTSMDCPVSAANVQHYLTANPFPGIDTSKMTVTTTWPDSGDSCTPSVTPCNNPGNNVLVMVTYQFPLSIPFIPAETLNMTSTSEMVISQ